MQLTFPPRRRADLSADRNQVKYLVASGRLAGEEMPPIRVLAERLLINPNTVARATAKSRPRDETSHRRHVCSTAALLARERLKILTERIDALLAEAGQMNASKWTKS